MPEYVRWSDSRVLYPSRVVEEYNLSEANQNNADETGKSIIEEPHLRKNCPTTLDLPPVSETHGSLLTY